MSKTPPEEMVEDVLEELTTLVRSGTVDADRVARSLGFSGLEIDEFDRLKRIHFVIHPDVVEYVRKLPERLRNVTRESTRQTELRRHVDDKIDWGRTTKMRYSDNYGDSSVFVCESPALEYDVPENLVLKKLLWVIYRTITEDVRHVDYSVAGEPEAEWFEGLISEMESIFERNIHLNRIQDVKDLEITGRHLQTARQSRQPLYQHAYDLFSVYDELMRDEFAGRAGVVLKETLLLPEQTHRLFEFYVVFMLLRALREEHEDLVLRPIGKGSNVIASAESETRRIDVYHDDTGSLRFEEKIGNQDPAAVENARFLRRHRTASEQYATLAERFLGERRSLSLFRGRPDFVVETYRTDGEERLESVLIGEVKYTESESTFQDGLEQLTEYLNYCRVDETYLTESETSVAGLLVTDGFETRASAAGDELDRNGTDPTDGWDSTIHHCTTDDLQRGRGRLEELCSFLTEWER